MTNRSDTVAEVLGELKKKPFEELARLPPYTESRKSRKLTVSVWVDKTNDADIRVVVQGYEHKILGMGMMCADGFHKRPDGTIISLAAGELSEFT